MRHINITNATHPSCLRHYPLHSRSNVNKLRPPPSLHPQSFHRKSLSRPQSSLASRLLCDSSAPLRLFTLSLEGCVIFFFACAKFLPFLISGSAFHCKLSTVNCSSQCPTASKTTS